MNKTNQTVSREQRIAESNACASEETLRNQEILNNENERTIRNLLAVTASGNAPKVSILSNGKTRELFNQLDKSNPARMVRVDSNYAHVTLGLRYSYVRDTYGYDQKTFTPKVRYIPTGGMLLTWTLHNIDRTFSKLWDGEVRIKPDTAARQEKAVSRAIHRILRMATLERLRVHEVKHLDAMVKPFVDTPGFLSWVEQMEAKDGKTSDYVLLSREEAETWQKRVKAWVASQIHNSDKTSGQ